MKLLSIIVFAFAGFTCAVDFSNWHPPVAGDLRSPCPALNSLANHDIIPHDGRNLSVPLLVKAMTEALNTTVEIATTVALAGLRTSSDPASGTYTLEDLKKHNIVEHDGSLSRKDVGEGSVGTLCLVKFKEFLGFFGGAKDITIPLAAAARWGRIKSEKASDPSFNLTSAGRFNSYLESAIYLEVLKDPKTGTTPVEFIKIFFEQERLPFNEGWRPVTPITAFGMMQDILALSLNTPEEKAPPLNRRGVGFHGLKL